MPTLRKEPERTPAKNRIERREDLPPCPYAGAGTENGRGAGSKKEKE